MKKLIVSGFVAGMIFNIAPIANTALANTLAVAQPGATGSILSGPGQYRVDSYDRTKLEQIAVEHFRTNQQEDKQFLIDTVASIESGMNSLVELINDKGGIVSLYKEKSAQGQEISLTEYLAATQEIVALQRQIENKIGGVLLVPSMIQSATDVQARGEQTINLPAKLRVDLNAVQGFYSAQMTNIISQAQNLNFIVALPNGVRENIKGIDFIPSGNIYTADQLKKMRESAMKDMRVGNEIRSQLNTMNRLTMNELDAAISAFGKSQTYRLQVNKEGKEINLERLVELFWARDYLRAQYGIPLGAIAVNYQKKGWNWDFLSSSNDIPFLSEFITRSAELTQFQDKIANALQTQKSRSQEVFGEGVSLLDRVMSGYTFIRGESQLAAINFVILTLLERDIRHEMMLASIGGTRQVRQAYREIYYAGDQVRNRTYSREDNYNTALSGSDDVESDLTAFSSDCGTLACAYRVSQAALDNVVDRVEQANQQMMALERIRSTSKTVDKINRRRNNLRRQ